jgi:predicted enzyme related to lactoylglutathione lyase
MVQGVQLGEVVLVLGCCSSADEAVAVVAHAGGRRISGPSDVPVGRLAVVADVFGNELVLLDLSKGTCVVDQSGHVTGVADRSVRQPQP